MTSSCSRRKSVSRSSRLRPRSGGVLERDDVVVRPRPEREEGDDVEGAAHSAENVAARQEPVQGEVGEVGGGLRLLVALGRTSRFGRRETSRREGVRRRRPRRRPSSSFRRGGPGRTGRAARGRATGGGGSSRTRRGRPGGARSARRRASREGPWRWGCRGDASTRSSRGRPGGAARPRTGGGGTSPPDRRAASARTCVAAS